MKLASKSNLYFLIATLIVFFLSGINVYFILQSTIREEIDDELENKRDRLLKELEVTGGFEHLVLPSDSSITIGSVITGGKREKDVYKDITVSAYDSDEREEERILFRQLKSQVSYHGETRIVKVRLSLIKSDDLIEAIIYSLFFIFIIMIFTLVAVNSIGIKRLWSPFRLILERIRGFDFRSQNQYTPVSSNIDEFNQLNDELIRMTTKLSRDYQALKEFSENASHEMQTPLAIIQSKLELLFQKQDLKKEHLKTMTAIYQAVNRLSRLHGDLSLLMRIGNKEFDDLSIIHLRPLLEVQLDNVRDLIEMKRLKLTSDLNSENVVKANKDLIEIMASNLIGNAIKHNFKDGTIHIGLTKNELTVSNSGAEPEVPPEQLFDRFRKGRSGSDSTGLGLALVRQICELYGFDIRYTFDDGRHIIRINFMVMLIPFLCILVSL